MKPKAKVFFGAFAIALVADLVTKHAVATWVHYGERIEVVPGFLWLTHVRNPGAAFGLFSSSPASARLAFFVVVTLVAMALISSFYRNLAPGDRFSALSLGLILGGASGNLYDRVVHREVIDFLHVVLPGGYPFPDFNVADSCIVVGVLLLVLELFASEGESREGAVASDGDA